MEWFSRKTGSRLCVAVLSLMLLVPGASCSSHRDGDTVRPAARKTARPTPTASATPSQGNRGLTLRPLYRVRLEVWPDGRVYYALPGSQFTLVRVTRHMISVGRQGKRTVRQVEIRVKTSAFRTEGDLPLCDRRAGCAQLVAGSGNQMLVTSVKEANVALREGGVLLRGSEATVFFVW